MASGSKLVVLAALGGNLAIAVTKFAAALIAGSSSMLTEGIHSAVDTFNELLLLYGRKRATQPPDELHPLGHARELYFWGFVVALVFFTGGAGFSIYEGIHKLQGHEGLQSPWIAVAILAFSAVAEGISQAIAMKQITRLRGDRSLWRWFRETRRSELLVVFSENAAALVGLAIALAAVLLAMATGNDLYDAGGTIAVGVLLVVVALILAAEIKSLLIGESAAPAVRDAIRDFLDAREEIVEIASMITQQQGEAIMLNVKARMRRTTTAGELVAAIARCETALQTAFPQVKWIFFEPLPRSKD